MTKSTPAREPRIALTTEPAPWEGNLYALHWRDALTWCTTTIHRENLDAARTYLYGLTSDLRECSLLVIVALDEQLVWTGTYR